ncbi:hypothetical protein KEM48_013607 [Puccinia striiformis f. sp. tritici PST-130]|nr:hypothetical protein KEM48_013607 [Puccinia striiformis f. sp. tritici PST-130]
MGWRSAYYECFEQSSYRLTISTDNDLSVSNHNDKKEAWLFLFAVILAAVLLFTAVFYIIMFSDLEYEPIRSTRDGSTYVFSPAIVLSFQFVATLINAPLIAWNVNKVMKKTHMYDATEIFRTLAQHKKESFLNLGFTYYLSSTIYSG